MSIIELTDEQQMIRDVARDFAQNEIKPVAAELDREGRFPADLVKKIGDLGLWESLFLMSTAEAGWIR